MKGKRLGAVVPTWRDSAGFSFALEAGPDVDGVTVVVNFVSGSIRYSTHAQLFAPKAALGEIMSIEDRETSHRAFVCTHFMAAIDFKGLSHGPTVT